MHVKSTEHAKSRCEQNISTDISVLTILDCFPQLILISINTFLLQLVIDFVHASAVFF